jgi:hypothetical protein
MSLTFLYRDLDATDTDITPYVVLRFGQNPQGMAENAEERSVGSWDLEIEDEGVLDLHAQRTFYVLEDDTYDADNVLWVGQTFDKHSGRGDTWRTGAGRVYTLNLIDLNTLLERRVIQSGDDPDRPEESDVERMLWLQGLGYIGVTDDWISTADPVDMDAVDYTGRMASEVIEDCSQQSTKNAFMFRDPDADTFAVFYGDSSADVDILTSDIRLSNVLADIDNVTTFEVNLDADLWEANSRIYSGINANYDGGFVYVENATTVANFSHRDTALSWPDVKTATKATARAVRQLAIIGSEEYRITTALEVPSTQVGLFPHAGWRLEARFSHYPRFTEFTWFRILSRNTTLIGPNRYRIQYELSPGPVVAPAGTCATSVASTERTGEVTEGSGGFTPASIPVSAASFDSAMQISYFTYVGPLMGLGGCAPLVVGGSGWSLLFQESDLGSAAWVALGYQAQPTIATPANMTVSEMCTGGGPAAFVGHTFAFPSSSTAPIQQSPLTGTGIAVLPSAPTVGNILYMWAMGSINIDNSQWVADGGTLLVNSQSINGGQWYLSIGIRCVTDDDTDSITIPAGSHANYGNVSEWAP